MLGWLLLVGALVVGARDINRYVETESYEPLVGGELWYDLHAPSLNLAQAVIERYVLVALWDPLILTILQIPAWVLFAVPGILLSVFCRAGRRQRLVPE